jgi:hypothetical protein
VGCGIETRNPEPGTRNVSPTPAAHDLVAGEGELPARRGLDAVAMPAFHAGLERTVGAVGIGGFVEVDVLAAHGASVPKKKDRLDRSQSPERSGRPLQVARFL